MKVRKFEQKVWDVEGIRIVVHADATVTVKDYKKKNGADGNWTIADWKQKRIDTCLNGHGYVVIGSTGKPPHGKYKLDKVRASYAAKLSG